MGLCVVCLGELGGQRWRYCSDTCNNRNSSRDLRARNWIRDLDDYNSTRRFEGIRANSSKAAYNLIRGML